MSRVILTPIVIDKITELLKKGTPVRYIAEEIGMSRFTFYSWLDKAERLEEKLHKGELNISELKNKTYTLNLIKLLTSIREVENDHYEKILTEFKSVLESNPSAQTKELYELTRDAVKGHYE